MTITQVTLEDGDRYYEISSSDSKIIKKYKSVTTLIDKFKDKTALFAWKKNIGEQAAQEITTRSTTRGTKVHSLIENYLKQKIIDESAEGFNLFFKLKPILDNIKPLYIERKLYWENPNNIDIGFGGTVDICGLIDTSIFTSTNLPEKMFYVGDWKTWNKPKEIYGVTKRGDKYYPLISYYLQLSAYCAAINQRTNNKYNINKCLIFGVTEESETPYIYYLNTECVKFYWGKMFELVNAFYNNDKFDWKLFEYYADMDNMLGERLFLKENNSAE